MMTDRPQRAPTLHDVAAHVGVSPRTVSRVVNDQGGFSRATRVRVLLAVDELRYRPNLLARSLVTRRSNTIAFVVPVLSDPFFPEVADGIQRAARAADLTMLFAISNGDVQTQHDVLSRLAAHSPDGAIVFPCDQDVEQLRPYLDRGLQMVVIDTPIDHPNASVILSDLRSGTHLAVDRLITGGRRHLAMIASVLTPPTLRRRQDAFVEFLPPGMEVIVECVTPDLEGGRSAMRRILERAPYIDGIFAYNDVTAIGAIEALRAAGRSVPDDVAVVGCDDIAMGAVITPALTTIRIDRERLGYEAVNAVTALVAGEPIESPLVLPVELVVRDSG